MATERERRGGKELARKNGGYKENHGDDSMVNKTTKGTFYQVGTVMPMTENAVSVNRKEPGHERGE
jgi:hypothetical protein